MANFEFLLGLTRCLAYKQSFSEQADHVRQLIALAIQDAEDAPQLNAQGR